MTWRGPRRLTDEQIPVLEGGMKGWNRKYTDTEIGWIESETNLHIIIFSLWNLSLWGKKLMMVQRISGGLQSVLQQVLWKGNENGPRWHSVNL